MIAPVIRAVTIVVVNALAITCLPPKAAEIIDLHSMTIVAVLRAISRHVLSLPRIAAVSLTLRANHTLAYRCILPLQLSEQLPAPSAG
jgi:hypothetical protein